jgi:23S rRNA-/tRNA-specific pseudouridylate synthase
LLFAKNEQVLPKLQGMFMERHIQKTYRCLVRGIPSEKEGLIDHPLRSERSGCRAAGPLCRRPMWRLSWRRSWPVAG